MGLGGLGLGLAIVHGLVEAHGGDVEVRSEGPGTGAEFLVRLPPRDPPRAGAPARPDRAAVRGRRVLVIDDHVDSAAGLLELLRAEGHQAEMAGDGRRGLELARSLRPELIICDLGLPGLDGYEVARRLRADPGLEAVDLVALSGFGDEAAVSQALAAGFDEHVTKPIDLATLRRLASGSPGDGAQVSSSSPDELDSRR
jgi:CheY-like chemotaxis protein